ncbi:MAG: pro-sigmaK processing inhibitor BofA family protein [Oscillospiraceae bacterium]|nr:pro-sigmaK processing inhibitor BofA family protein [Oscillospiraceae bacterium]
MENTIIVCLWIFITLIMILYYRKKKKPLKNFLFGVLTGLIALAAANQFGGCLGCKVNINLFNAATAAILGIPGVLMIMIAQLLHF